MQTEIEVRSNDWLINAGLVGFLNIVGKDNVKIDGQSIYFTADLLEDFETKYFSFFIQEYKETLAWSKIVSYKEAMERFRADGFASFDEDALNNLNKYVKNVVKFYLKKANYIKVFPLINSDANVNKWLENLNTINLTKKQKWEEVKPDIVEKVEQIYTQLDVIIDFCTSEKGLRYLGAKNLIYSVINKGWSGVSFLFKQTKFIDPYLDYKTTFVDPVIEYLDTDLSKAKYNCFNCNQPIKNLKLDLSFMNEVGFDTARKTSHVWDFNNDVATCPICRLVYSCVPAGFTYVYGEGMFVNDSYGVNELHRVNERMRKSILRFNKDGINSTNTYQALVESITSEHENNRRYELADIQLIRYENEHYHFNLLSKKMLHIMNDSKEILKSLIRCGYNEGNLNINLYKEVIQHLMNNENLFTLIHKLIFYKQSSVNGLYYNMWNVSGVLEINTKFLKEIEVMTNIEERDLTNAQKSGGDFKQAYVDKNSENKVSSITYKLLNALKLNDKNGFMDILLNSYSYLGKPVPTVFMSSFSSKETFKSIGYAFMIGVSANKTKSKNKDGGNTDEK
ncbi:type I-B CRISPR-associated protein Cas8b1/Cst1 [Listeria monocytogenes]|uniref:type I-B CRISPR-associated protein Cas8b1/Cst1 n=1 Tax=Listeria monocytogenes TaxID=1639 RepID=UPI000873B0BD|nr:type I-B CRISPR-associated protein Cas8b1/Cst1 [Listeria monocytogenes]EAD4265801.1 type I-B CRISPR-associated protein Cas8b1/Cst1 [Listeria monocytogenes]EAE7009998.1 type I-B CRISPR-associated protein Cas8b1/Cst1 [Listeria monocytogenes]EFQ8450502.1 type I-B CRISPR-associated protein Cas8b1/Cst1 [Listeria monocytogenes]EKZ1103502.1 type I-B CRISPR-associated protein Cas8b1/Cst1 [Listeria monocytogenes]EKZ1162748.1 type I-B CRISPR-associated protein Cas8b1/Cst1 [Listeria monocytogenes]